jgi:hypothetical protein
MSRSLSRGDMGNKPRNDRRYLSRNFDRNLFRYLNRYGSCNLTRNFNRYDFRCLCRSELSNR